MPIIERGANAPLATGPFRITVARTARPGTPAVACAAILLDAVGRVRDDADVVLAAGPRHPSGAVRHLGGAQEGGLLVQRLEVDPDDVEPSVRRILIAALTAGGTFGAVDGLSVEVAAGDGAPVARYEVTDAEMDTALVLGECYRRSGAWRFRAVGQGYTSGPDALAADYGIRPQALPAAPVAGPAMTEVDKRDGVPAPVTARTPAPAAAEPLPAPRRDPGRAGGPPRADVVHEGDGDGEVTVVNPEPGHAAILEYEALGPTDRDTWLTADRIDGRDEPLLVFHRGSHGLRGQLLAFAMGGREFRLRIEANCRWRLRLRPAGTAQALGTGASGRGTTVLRYDGPPALLRVERGRDKSASMEVFTLQADGGCHVVANADSHHPVTGPLAVGPGGWCHVLVETSETVSWKLEPMPLHTAPVLERKLSGRGAQVVLVRGKGATVDVRHDRFITPLFSLGPYLLPGERLCTEQGAHDLPPGPVSVRASGKWSLRIRD
ncbi:TerD family protein [Streptomyces sp. AP-93]|uniref:TerD family protein n=1 Tax=Streptomyces sp. AP-93 TaxID=2929048 RepID=UPI001FAFEA8A|nr:TerD family protein [Streptomyces sp. AP-93]MCJ0870829.1 TerD family protein [Streptomyces sp. AP-93]